MKYLKKYKLFENLEANVDDIIIDYTNNKLTLSETIQELNKFNDNDYVLLKSYEHYDLIKYYLEHGANPNYKKNNAHPVLSWVTYNNPDRVLDIVKMLIEYGADINSYAYHEKEKTALYFAIGNKNINQDVIFYLLDYGAILYETIIEEIEKEIPEILNKLKKYPSYQEYLKKKTVKKFKI